MSSGNEEENNGWFPSWFKNLLKINDNNTKKSQKQDNLKNKDVDEDEVSERQNLEGNRCLMNLGNTCYMNSALQCLIHSLEFTQYTIQYESKFDAKGEVSKEYRKLVKIMKNKTQKQAVRPQSFKKAISRYNNHFDGYGQKDSPELLATVLDAINQQTRDIIQGYPSKFDLDEEKSQFLTDQELSKFYKLKYLHYNSSMVTKLFFGQLKSTIKCNVCIKDKNISSNYKGMRVFDSFGIIYLPIREQNQQRINKSLQECLQSFGKAQQLVDQNKWYCKNCKEDMPSTKNISLYATETFIIFGLKRFFQGKKLDHLINFDKEIDLAKFFQSNSGIILEKQSLKQTKYELYGVINHSGGIYSGHYTAFCKNMKENTWHEFNDSFSHQISEDQVVSSRAYVLFYRIKDGQPQTK